MIAGWRPGMAKEDGSPASATRETIVNALCMATTMTAINGKVSHAVTLDRLREVMDRYHDR